MRASEDKTGAHQHVGGEAIEQIRDMCDLAVARQYDLGKRVGSGCVSLDLDGD